jgi:hypothetical protein
MMEENQSATDRATEARKGSEVGKDDKTLKSARTSADGDASPGEGGKKRVRRLPGSFLLVAGLLLVGALVGVMTTRFLGSDATPENEAEDPPPGREGTPAAPRAASAKLLSIEELNLEDASSELKVGLGFLRNVRYADAVRVLSRYARSDERKSDAERIALYSGLSEGYRGLGQEDRGAIYARKARKLVEESGVSVGLLDLAEESFQAGDFAEARKLFYRYLCASGDPEDLENELVSVAFFRIADTYRDEVAGRVAGRETP